MKPTANQQRHRKVIIGTAELMPEKEAREGTPLTLPAFGQDFEAYVLCEQKAGKLMSTLQQLLIGQLRTAIFVGHRGVCLGQGKTRILSTHLVDRPTVCQVIHHKLRNPNPRHPHQSRRPPYELFNMRICQFQGHVFVVTIAEPGVKRNSGG